MPTNGQSQETMRQTTMSTGSIPAGAGDFKVVNIRRQIHGRERRVRVLTFTTHDGFVGESRTFKHREAYEAAVAARATALFEAREASINATPRSSFERVNKPAPAAQLLNAISESMLFSEVERRGYEVAIAS